MDKKIILDHVDAYKNEEYQGIRFEWHGNIGWGEYNLYKVNDEDGWHGDSECLDDNENKSFLIELMKQFINEIKID